MVRHYKMQQGGFEPSTHSSEHQTSPLATCIFCPLFHYPFPPFLTSLFHNNQTYSINPHQIFQLNILKTLPPPIIMFRKYKTPPLPNHLPSSLRLNQSHQNSSFALISQSSIVSKLESKKKHFISVSKQNSQILKSTSETKLWLKQELLESCKPSKLHIKIKNITNDLCNTLVIYNNNLDENSGYKKSINRLRMEKRRNKEIVEGLEMEIRECEERLGVVRGEIGRLEGRNGERAGNIQGLMERDRERGEKHDEELERLGREFDQGEEEISRHHPSLIDTTEIVVDTHLVLKNRLKNIIDKNKKMHQQVNIYEDILAQIRSQFEEIMYREKVSDAQEVTNLFGATYEQNESLYNYINELSSSITDLERETKEIEGRVREQREKNMEIKGVMQRTDKKRRVKDGVRESLVEGVERMRGFKRGFVEKVAPVLKRTLMYFSEGLKGEAEGQERRFDLKQNFDLNEKSIESYLSELQSYINRLYQLWCLRANPRNKFTKLSLPPPISPYPSYPPHEQTHEFSKHLLTRSQLTQLAQQHLESKSPRHRLQHLH